MSDLRFQRQLSFGRKFPVVFQRKDRIPSFPAPVNWYLELVRRYGFFPKFLKLPVLDHKQHLIGWRFYRFGDRYRWGRDFVELVRDIKASEAHSARRRNR